MVNSIHWSWYIRLVIMVSMMRIQNIKDIKQHIFTFEIKTITNLTINSGILSTIVKLPHYLYPKNTIYKNIIANAARTNFVSVITLYNFDPSHTLFCPIFKSKWYFRLRSYLLGPLALLQTESRFGFFIIKLKWGDINVMVVMMKSNHSPKGKKPTISAVQTEFQVTAEDSSLSRATGTIITITMIAMDTLIFVGVLWVTKITLKVANMAKDFPGGPKLP